MKIRELAEKIARCLFTDATGARANRLVRERPDGNLGGGWSEKPMTDRIEEILSYAGPAVDRVPAQRQTPTRSAEGRHMAIESKGAARSKSAAKGTGKPKAARAGSLAARPNRRR